MPLGQGGLTALALGLFHPYKKVRYAVADLLERIDIHPVPPALASSAFYLWVIHLMAFRLGSISFRR